MSIVKNFAYNSAITVSSYIVNFVIFTVISRTLGVSNIGIVSYVDNIINYFVLFASLGISTVGIREIAATRGDREKCSRVFFQLVSFLVITVSISTLIYIVSFLTLPKLSEYRPYFIIGLGKLLLTPLMIEWLYAGNQDFKYISIRTISIKFLYLLGVVCLVRDSDDTILYFILTSLSIVINFIINMISSRKFIDYKYFTWDWKPFCKPIAKLGAFAIITSLYSTFNYVYLGSVTTTVQVGFYYTAIRLYDVIMQVFRSYTAVVMPRMSEYSASSDKKSFDAMVDKSFKALLSYSIPMAIIATLIAPFLVQLIAGEGYEPATTAMRIVMPILIIAGVNQINGIQILMPLHKDNVLLITASIAALVGIVSNIMLDRQFGANGAAITILLSESAGCIGGLFYTLRNKLIRIPYKVFTQYTVTSIPYFIIYYIVRFMVADYYVSYILMILIMFIYFINQQIFICKNDVAIEIKNRIIRRLK